MSNDPHNLIWKIATKTQLYCPGQIGWIARQHVHGEFLEGDADVWAFVIGEGSASLTIGEAKVGDKALILKLAEQILGYPVDSKSDLERYAKEADWQIKNIETQQKGLERQLEYWTGVWVRATDGLERLGN